MYPTLPNHSLRPAAAAAGQLAGNWQLAGLPQSSFPFLAFALSAGVHAVFLLGFNQHGARLTSIVRAPAPPALRWNLADDPEPPTPTEVKPFDEPPVVSVPRIADLPLRIDLQNDFVQPLEPTAPLPELGGDPVLTIPTNVGNSGAGTLPPDTFRPEQLDRPPRVVAQPAPHYPHEMRNLAVSAEVVVAFVVDTSGAVQSATIVSSTHPGFDRAALDGVRRWKFRPGLKDGRKVSTRMLQPIRFSVDENPGT